jgi:hypothetical protein
MANRALDVDLVDVERAKVEASQFMAGADGWSAGGGLGGGAALGSGWKVWDGVDGVECVVEGRVVEREGGKGRGFRGEARDLGTRGCRRRLIGNSGGCKHVITGLLRGVRGRLHRGHALMLRARRVRGVRGRRRSGGKGGSADAARLRLHIGTRGRQCEALLGEGGSGAGRPGPGGDGAVRRRSGDESARWSRGRGVGSAGGDLA